MQDKKLRVSGSVWSADLSNWGQELKSVEDMCDGFHFDIMDGHCVHNLLFRPDIVFRLRKLLNKPSDIHYMVKHPGNFIRDFID